MEEQLINKVVYSVLVILLFFIINRIINARFHRNIKRLGLKSTQEVLLKKIVNLIMTFLVIVGLISIWSVDYRQLWIFITSIVGLIAIGFVAVWSILSNTMAGLIILGSKNFKIDDKIVILPENIEGTIKDINLFFVTLESDGNKIFLPNNMFFQKIIKRIT